MPTFEKGFQKYYNGGVVRRTIQGKYAGEVHLDGHRPRATFRTIGEAKEWIDRLQSERDREGQVVLALSANQIRDAMRGLEVLRKADLYPGIGLAECAEAYVTGVGSREGLGTVQQWYDRYLTFLSNPDDGGSPARPRTLDTKRVRLAPFLDQFGDRDLTGITKAEIDAFSGSLGIEGRNLRNTRVEIQSLFNHIERRSEGAYTNTVAKFPQRKRKEIAPAEIVTAEQSREWLHTLESIYPPSALALALGCFGGIRSGELSTNDAESPVLQWHDIDFEEQIIHVPAAASKTRNRREVPLMSNLRDWLLRYRVDEEGRPRSGPIAPHLSLWAQHRKRTAQITGARWPRNGARHSFGTYYGRLHGYRVAADAMGHLGGMSIFESNYRGRAVSKADAESYFRILPSDTRGGEVVDFAIGGEP